MMAIQARTELALQCALPKADAVPIRLHNAMRYAVLGGGKRVRALLVHAAGEVAPRPLLEADLVRLDWVAAAVECLHAYSLVHDDMPCMDNDVLRRGKPTVHVEFDEATALLVGDSLQTLAYQLLASKPTAPTAEGSLAMIRILAQAAGSLGMAGGQAMDLESVGKSLTDSDLQRMHEHKTGAVIRASAALGARVIGALTDAELASLDEYAHCIGLAFQVVDDVLDAEGTTAMLGKTAGKDALANKPTYVGIMGLSGAKQFAGELREKALESIANFGASARRLREVADFIALRKS
ncbi:MAG: polyprenyl synthetase family protein [Burkholderiales bacterium]